MELYFNETKLSDIENKYLKSLPDLLNINGFSALFSGFPFIEEAEESRTFKGLLVYHGGIMVFYNDEQEKDLYKRYVIQQVLVSNEISNIINYRFDDFISFYKIGDVDIKITPDNKFNDSNIKTIISIFQKINALTKKDKRKINNLESMGAAIVKRNETEANLDNDQFNFVYNDLYANANIRVRGLAGCGKTILLAEKMAYLHYKNKDKLIGYVFYTKSLKQSVDSFFTRFYTQVANNNDIPQKNNIKIMHGWGSRQYPGLYSTVCDWLDFSNASYEDNPFFDNLCENLIKAIIDSGRENEIKRFDYILIDEAQDFTINFFKLARMCLKPDGKMIYAYDELQALNEINKKMPSKKDIFGTDTCKDINLSKCYRTPKEILVTAHALGLGIYHFNKSGERELINAIQEKDVWKVIGYKYDSETIKDGEDISFYREDLIFNPLGDNAIVCKDFNNQLLQFEYVIKEILYLILQEEVVPDDILVIDLDSRNINENYSMFREKYFEIFEENNYDLENPPFNVSIINKESGYNFRIKDRVSYTTIFRAKGNEANIVFVLNSNNSDSILSYNRNRLFTAMTRAKFKVYICGIGQDFIDTISREIQSVKENNYCLNFKYPTKEELKRCYRKVYEDNKTNEKADEVAEILSGAKGDELIKALFGKLNESEKKKIQEILLENKENE